MTLARWTLLGTLLFVLADCGGGPTSENGEGNVNATEGSATTTTGTSSGTTTTGTSGSGTGGGGGGEPLPPIERCEGDDCISTSDPLDPSTPGLSTACEGVSIYETVGNQDLAIQVCQREIEQAYRGSILFEAVRNSISPDSPQVQSQIDDLSIMCQTQQAENGQTIPSFVSNYLDLAILRELLARLGDINDANIRSQKASFRNFLRLQTLSSEYTIHVVMPTITPTAAEKQEFYNQNSEELNRLQVDNATLQRLIEEGVRRQRVGGVLQSRLEALRQARSIVIDEVAMTIEIDGNTVVTRDEAEAAYRTQVQVSAEGITETALEEFLGDVDNRYDFLDQYVYNVLMREALIAANEYNPDQINAQVQDMVEMFTMIWLRQRALQIEAQNVEVTSEEIFRGIEQARQQVPDASDEELEQAVRQQLLQMKAQSRLQRTISRYKNRLRINSNLVWC